MSGMFWIALELSILKIGLNIILSLTVKTLEAFTFDRVAESDNTGETGHLARGKMAVVTFYSEDEHSLFIKCLVIFLVSLKSF